MITIGITGTIGAGKGVAVEYLKTKGFKHYSAREFIIQEIDRRGIERTRDNMVTVANDFRRDHFPGYIISELLKEAQKNAENAVIESVRALGEIDLLKSAAENFSLFAITADPKVRYERILKRKASTDRITFEKFLEDEEREFESTSAWSQNIKMCILQSDYIFDNNGSVEEFHKKLEGVLIKFVK